MTLITNQMSYLIVFQMKKCFLLYNTVVFYLATPWCPWEQQLSTEQQQYNSEP